ncbi:hypothetical protein M1247_16640 [Mycobacterium sp. 21AC1]|nr:hypothetical protein [Mycobacterium sp. 21AC1]
MTSAPLSTRAGSTTATASTLGEAVNELGGPTPVRFESVHAHASVGHTNLRGLWDKQAASRSACLSCTVGERVATYPHIRFAFCRRHRQWLGDVQRQGVTGAELRKAEQLLRRLVTSGLVDRELYETAWDLVRDNTYLIGERARPERLQRVLDRGTFSYGTDDRIALFPETVRVIRIVTDPAIAHRISTGRRNDPAMRASLSDALEWVGVERWLLVNGAHELLQRRHAMAG